MSLAVLKWLSNGMIALVLAATLWMANALPSHGHQPILLAQTLPPAAAASAPQPTLR